MQMELPGVLLAWKLQVLAEKWGSCPVVALFKNSLKIKLVRASQSRGDQRYEDSSRRGTCGSNGADMNTLASGTV